MTLQAATIYHIFRRKAWSPLFFTHWKLKHIGYSSSQSYCACGTYWGKYGYASITFWQLTLRKPKKLTIIEKWIIEKCSACFSIHWHLQSYLRSGIYQVSSRFPATDVLWNQDKHWNSLLLPSFYAQNRSGLWLLKHIYSWSRNGKWFWIKYLIAWSVIFCKDNAGSY